MNKKRFKRRTATAAAIAAALLVLSACGASSKNGKAGTGAATDAKKNGTISVSLYDRGITPPDAGTPEKNSWTEWVNKNGPVNVNFVTIPRFESVSKFNALFASGDVPNYIQEFDVSFRNQLIAQKQVVPLDDLIDKYSTTYKALIQKYPQIKSFGVKADGKLYEFGRMGGVRVNEGLLIRADWLKKLNLQVPKTTEELYQVAKAFAENDPDGNGKKDSRGMSLSPTAPQPGNDKIVNQMFQNVTWVVENGALIRDWDRLKAATQFKKDLYEGGVVDKDFLADKNGEKSRQDWINGKLGIWGLNNAAEKYGLDAFTELMKNNPDAEVMAIPLPKSPFGQFSPVPAPPITYNGMITANAKDPESIIKYVDFMSEDATMKALKYGEENVHYKMSPNGCPQTINEDKWKKEVSWTTDFQMLSHFYLEGKCGLFSSQLDTGNPVNKSFKAIVDQANAAYLTTERPFPEFMHPSYYPSYPKDLQIIATNLEKQINDMMVKAIVSGNSYTVDQAIKDAKNVWEKTGGTKLEEWFGQWYKENKDKLMTKKEIYDLVQK
ncbi:extracellular solute-binding protein [Paenibacillus piri]|uniref:Extracellular solute-binding protein n=1 Tax=Paenibacillus piri TaxID=2547395 RepID=A0A4R5KYS6_9BACL|nr:extracellular solute-binding protein [Paenibacillus piri]TDG00298.1 extracellular solute-binding protein [Paenibacillus piri]